ncbi:hypothetical protein [Streptomyces shenzhenensis]|uniref:Uncharacterized protein n=1 Tax=Streptomyces shenzhenensis TaxID=943815 RepID=A0A3M0HZ96_9ACTN|nr:hypothetical protein [Streptomyces shenzhenensis]RMB81310.1 hypothetical protein CTZ28_35520 [Streptomyces shenzhenensis]
MAQPMCLAALFGAGDAWLAECSARPDLVHQTWGLEALAPIPSGRLWLAAECRLVAGMQALSRIREEHRGPVLADPAVDLTWWLLPLHAGNELTDVRQVTVQPPGTPLHCPPTGRQVCGRFWLTHPDGSGRLTEPAILAAALGPGGRQIPAEVLR